MARYERDKGIGRVTGKNGPWMWRGLKWMVTGLPKGWTGTGEDLRLVLLPIIGEPTHHNAWGALVMHAQIQEPPLIKPTGRFFQMKLKKSHARITREYVRPSYRKQKMIR